MRLIKSFLLLTLLDLVNSAKLLSISPDSVDKEFSGQIDIHEVEIEIKNGYNNMMLFIGTVILPYDREPFDSAYVYCQGKSNQLVKDWVHQEGHYYSCCQHLSTNNSIWKYICPIAPAEVNPDPFRTFITSDVKQVYIKQVSSNSSWIKTDQTFTYLDTTTGQGILRKFLTLFFVGSLSLLFISTLMTNVNLFSNKYPFTTTILHLLSTLFCILVVYALYDETEKDDSGRGDILRQGLNYSMLTLIYSLFMIYIPGRKDPTDSTSEEQRISINRKSHFYKCVKLLKSKHAKEFFSIIFISLTILQGWSLYSLLECFREYFDFSWDGLLCVAIWYSILSVVFLVSFLTAIYEIKIPIKFDEKTGQMLHVLPETRLRRELAAQNESKKVKPDVENQKKYLVGFCDEDEIIHLDYDRIREGDIVSIDDDFTNYDNDFRYLIWRIGKIKNDEVIIDNKVLVSIRTIGCMNRKKGKVKLKYRDIKAKLKLYTVVKIDDTDRYRFVKYGTLENGYIHQDYHLILQTVASILKIIPDYSPDYNYNVVENFRTEFQKLTKGCGKIYGIFYWISFAIVTIILIVKDVLLGTNPINILFIITMTFFAIIVNTKLIKNPVLRKQNNFNNQFDRLQMGHRGDEEIIPCQLDITWLKNNQILNLSNEIFFHNNTNWLIFSEFQQDFYMELTDFNLLGLGMIQSTNDIVNDNLFETLNPGLWLNQDQVKIICNKELKTSQINKFLGFGRMNNKFFFNTLTDYCMVNSNNGLIALCFSDLQPKFNLYQLNYHCFANNKIIQLPQLDKNYTNPFTLNLRPLHIDKQGEYQDKIQIAKLKKDQLVKCWEYDKAIEVKWCNKKPKMNGLTLVFNKEYNFDQPFKFNIDIDYLGNSNPEFVAFGLAENKINYYQNYIDVVPGWNSSRSIGFHSDDGSICISDGEKVINAIDDKLIWPNNNRFNLTIGFDGIWLYFEDAYGKRISCPDYSILNQEDIYYSPMIHFSGEFETNIKIQIDS